MIIPTSFRRWRSSLAPASTNSATAMRRACRALTASGSRRSCPRARGWDGVLRATVANAPYHFIRYWTSDTGSLMRRCSSYLMRKHDRRAQYRHDPSVMLDAPLRTAIHEDADGCTWFNADQLSTGLRSFRDLAIIHIGLELGHKLAALLEHLGAAVSRALTR